MGPAVRSPDRVDLGLFGPESVSWRVHAEPILWLAALRALFLQMLLPRAIAGVVQNSSFRDDPWGRLFRTAQFFGQVIFGDVATAQQAGARVRRRHASLRGIDPDTGEQFRIDEQELLRWIHVTAAESFCTTARRGGLRLTAAEVDRYYTEQLRVAELVGLTTWVLPADASAASAESRRGRDGPVPGAAQLPVGARVHPHPSTMDRRGCVRLQPAATVGPPPLRPARPARHRPGRHADLAQRAARAAGRPGAAAGRADLPERHGTGGTGLG
jgi:hypothetical protein